MNLSATWTRRPELFTKVERMPGRQTIRRFGFKVSVRPAFWLRRWTRFPFYFESHNPSFEVAISRTGAGEWPTPLAATIQVAFADKTTTHSMFDRPELEIGESVTYLLPNIYTAHPGQTIIRLLLVDGIEDAQWETLYSYQVRTEEQLWLSLLAGILAVITTIGAASPGWTRLLPSDEHNAAVVEQMPTPAPGEQ